MKTKTKTNLPFHWQIKRLGDVCKTTSGGTPSRKNNGYYNGDILWVKSGELDKGVIYDTEEKIALEAVNNSSAKVFPKGTLLIALYGATIGKMAFLGVDAATNQAICGIFENKNVVSKYLYYFLFLKKPSLIDQGIGGAQPNISQGILKNLQIPIPSLPEQEQIVAKIEELFSELDAGVENIKTAQEQLKVYRQSLLKWAFEGKLTNEDVKDGELPKGWRKEKLKNLTSILGDGLHGTPNYFENGEYYFINGNNLLSGKIFIKNNTKRVDEKEYNKHKKPLDESSVLVSINGTIGNTAFYRGEKIILGKSACYFNLLENVSKFYIRYFIMSPMFMQYANKVSTGSTIKNLSLKSMREMLIPLPCFDEQLKIVEELESRLTVCDKLEEDIKFSLARAESLRQSILKQAFEGKLLNFNGETDK